MSVNMKRVLAFHCHPDDVEFQVSGTLALLEQAGWEIHIATMAGGEVGSVVLGGEAIRAVRLKEAAAAADLLGGHYHYAGGHDLCIQYDSWHLRQAVRIMREVDPQIVFAPPPTDYLVDHEETSRLVRTAAFIASVPNYDCGEPSIATAGIPHLYYCHAAGLSDIYGRPLPMQMAVDISAVIDIKREMLACHASQRSWLQYVNGMDDYLQQMEVDAQVQGQAVGVVFAESFMQHLGRGHPTDNLLHAILGDRCIPLSLEHGGNVHA
ncbi:PIG-L deacetylase family protein [Phycisphaerales bacterium AB-hyl4]|uniref:PIG-L deacetylase family protein n=1 Tax=Natronomicrosphaera hydrolytica TaxID=3242702 RepID=A0ABV4U390_9BACT